MQSPDPSISRRHATLRVQAAASGCEIWRAITASGSTANGWREGHGSLQPGAQIHGDEVRVSS